MIIGQQMFGVAFHSHKSYFMIYTSQNQQMTERKNIPNILLQFIHSTDLQLVESENTSIVFAKPAGCKKVLCVSVKQCWSKTT